jgi:hypothetical protein
MGFMGGRSTTPRCGKVGNLWIQAHAQWDMITFADGQHVVSPTIVPGGVATALWIVDVNHPKPMPHSVRLFLRAKHHFTRQGLDSTPQLQINVARDAFEALFLGVDCLLVVCS